MKQDHLRIMSEAFQPRLRRRSKIRGYHRLRLTRSMARRLWVWWRLERCGEREQEVAPTYLNNLGELCDESEGRGSVRVGAFDVMLHDTEAVIQRRESKYLGAALTRSRL